MHNFLFKPLLPLFKSFIYSGFPPSSSIVVTIIIIITSSSSSSSHHHHHHHHKNHHHHHLCAFIRQVSHRVLTKFLHSALFLATCAASPQQPIWFRSFSTIFSMYLSITLAFFFQVVATLQHKRYPGVTGAFFPQKMSNPLQSSVPILNTEHIFTES